MDQSMWRSREQSRTKRTSRSLGAVRGVQWTMDIFNTLRLFSKEPIREQEIEMECMNIN